MSRAKVNKLRVAIQADPALREKLGTLRTGEELHAALARAAVEKGLTITAQEIEAVMAAQPPRGPVELSPEEIVSLAGGFHIRPPKTATVQFGETLIRTTRWFGIPLRR